MIDPMRILSLNCLQIDELSLLRGMPSLEQMIKILLDNPNGLSANEMGQKLHRSKSTISCNLVHHKNIFCKLGNAKWGIINANNKW